MIAANCYENICLQYITPLLYYGPQTDSFDVLLFFLFLIYHHQDWVQGARGRDMKGKSAGGQKRRNAISHSQNELYLI